MIKRALRHIRQKPKAVRDQYALAIASIFTAIVIMVWLATGVADTRTDDSTVQAGNTPFSNLIKQAKDQFVASKASLVETQKAANASSTDDLSTSTSAGDMILSPETLEGFSQSSTSTSTKDQSGKAVQVSTTTILQYIEVQIATTTSSGTAPATSPQ